MKTLGVLKDICTYFHQITRSRSQYNQKSIFPIFHFFQLWVRALQAPFFYYKSNFGYHRLCFHKATPKTFLHLNLLPLICTSRLHPLHFVIFLQNPQICVVNVFIHSYLNFHFYFPNVSWFKSVISQLSNALSTMSISLLDPEILDNIPYPSQIRRFQM